MTPFAAGSQGGRRGQLMEPACGQDGTTLSGAGTQQTNAGRRGTFGGTVTKTNNKQNRIENRDFVSLDPEQNRSKTELAVEGIQYQLMPSEAVAKSPTSFDPVESTTALACASGDVSLVVQLKREVGKLWENLEKALCKQLFNAGINGIFVWRCVQLQRTIDSELEKIATAASEVGGREYGVAIHGNRIIAALAFGRTSVATTSDNRYYVK
jgi:hypothetical protein